MTIAPKFENTNDIVIKVKAFEDKVLPNQQHNPNAPYKYTPPLSEAEYQEGFDKLTVKVGKASPVVTAAGHSVSLTNLRVVPAGGFIIVGTDLAGTGISLPTNNDTDNNVPLASERTPAQLQYNAIPVALPNLEAFLGNGGTIDLVSPNAGLVISEIMWGSDASLADEQPEPVDRNQEHNGCEYQRRAIKRISCFSMDRMRRCQRRRRQ